MKRLLASLRRVGIIARAEMTRTTGAFSKKGAIALLALTLIAGALTPVVGNRGFDFDHGLYAAAVPDGSPLSSAVDGSRLFRHVHTDDPFGALDRGEVDVAVQGSEVRASDSDKGHSALAALRDAAKSYTFSLMAQEQDQDAAFPVRVTLTYEAQQKTPGGPTVDVNAVTPPAASTAPSAGSTSGGGTRIPLTGSVAPSSAGGFQFLPPDTQQNTPGGLAPPFPFRSLILAYLFLIPMNFVVQVYAGSALAERTGRKGEALLASPARPWEIITGKALPYFTAMMVVGAIVAFFLGGTWLSLLAMVPLALAFLAFEFVAAMFARSFRELTFLTVFVSVLLTIYCFLPAVFTDVHPVSLVSPITLVVLDLKHVAVPFSHVMYAVLPLSLVSGVLFLLGASLYREEDLFHQKPVYAKALDALARQVTSAGSAFKLSILLIPFVFAGELLLITFLFAWPAKAGLFVILLAVAFVEELFKAAPSYAALQRGARPLTDASALTFGALAGLGFFVAEKGFLLTSMIGLFDVPAAKAVFGLSGAAGGSIASFWPLLLIGPLVLHVVTAGMSAWGARYGPRMFAVAFTCAVFVHTLYNYTIIKLLGGA